MEVNEKEIYKAFYEALASLSSEDLHDLTMEPWWGLAG